MLSECWARFTINFDMSDDYGGSKFYKIVKHEQPGMVLDFDPYRHIRCLCNVKITDSLSKVGEGRNLRFEIQLLFF